MKLIILLVIMAQYSFAIGEYLEVREVGKISDVTEVCLQVADKADASNKLAEVTADYFVDIPYKAQHIKNNHGTIDGTMNKPCESTPLANDDKMMVEVEVTDTPQYGQKEFIRIECIDQSDADKKAKQIKDKYFKGKPTKTKINGKEKP